MPRRGLRAVSVSVFGLLLLGLATAASDVPTAEDVYVTVLRDVPERFILSAGDASIVPQDPAVHPLRFLIIDGPTHGAILGDLTDVAYSGSQRATVELDYIPAAGYVGGDEISFVAVDPFGSTSAAAVVRIAVIAERATGLLAGAWDAEWTINVQSAAITAFTQRLTEAYRVGAFVLKGVAEFRMQSTGGPTAIQFDALRFVSEAAVGAVRAKATLAFDPKRTPASELFDYLLANVGVDLFGVSLSHTLFLTRPQTHSYQTLAVGGAIGNVGFSNTVRFGLAEDCGFAFSRDDVQATWMWCDAALRAAAGFTSAGFESATVSALGIQIPRFSWLPGGVTADVTLTFKPTEKTVSVRADWVPGAIGCVRVLGELATGANEFVVDHAAIYGLVLECDVAPYVHVKSATSFDPAKNATVIGQVDYFESFGLSGDLGSCCGVPGTWSAVTYFRTGSSQLFDWGMTVLKADVGVSEHFSVRFDLAVRSGELGDPLSEFTIGWTARW